MNIKIYLDSANLEALKQYPFLAGMTTNPTIMHKAGVTDYGAFAKSVLAAIGGRSISFEVFADNFGEMERQAELIGSWAENVYVKIPITNTSGESSLPLARRLLDKKIKVNLTAILAEEQIKNSHAMLRAEDDVIISIFAGRIADTGADPVPIMQAAVQMYAHLPKAQILWASPREVLNVYQAESLGCHIITVTEDLLKKLSLKGKPLADYSLETVKMFYDDGQKAGFKL